jgi:hypothetical protein
MNDPDDFGSLEQEVGYGLCIFRMLPDAQRQRLQPLQDQNALNGDNAAPMSRSKVTRALAA